MLIHGGGGGVGHLAVQIAKASGAQVIATASAGKHEFVRGLGADDVIDYRAADFTEVVTTSTSSSTRSAVTTACARSQVLRPGGLLLTVADRTNTELGRNSRPGDGSPGSP